MEGPGYPQGQNLPNLLHLRQSKVGAKMFSLFPIHFNIDIIPLPNICLLFLWRFKVETTEYGLAKVGLGSGRSSCNTYNINT